MSSPSAPIRPPSLRRLTPRSPLGLALASIVCLSGVTLSPGCDAGPVEAQAPRAPVPVRLPADRPADDPQPGASRAGHPLAGLERIDGRLVGDVAEVLPAGGYTYFRLVDGTWAVVMGRGPAVGARVRARVFAETRDFRSRRLGRTFAAVRFVSLTGG